MKLPLRLLWFFWLLMLAGLVSPVTAAETAQSKVVLGTNVASAYATRYEPLLTGASVEHVGCIFNRLQRPHRVISMPWRRAHREVRSQNIDAFFTSLIPADAEPEGAYSQPLVLENWYWFWRADTAEPESWRDSYKLGAILGSPQAEWMKREKYPDPMTANNLPQLLKLLFSKRIDVVMADKEHFDSAAAKLQIPSDSYQYRFYRYAPLGVYFGEHFILGEPGFLEQFNQHIHHCAPEGFQISEFEREKIKQQLLPRIHEWIAHPLLVKAVIKQNSLYRDEKLEDMLVKERRWQSDAQRGATGFPVVLLQNSLSKILRRFKAKEGGLVTEIIVMDERGFNVGISDMTSDFWQGDEAKFTQIFNQPRDTIFFDAVLLDQSTGRFQVQLSVQLFQPEKMQAIGVMTVAVDVEKILSLSY